MDKEQSIFEKLSQLNLNEKVEKKNNLTYLSWAHAWSEFKKQLPEATYDVVEYEGKPFCYDENLGYMVKTYVVANGETIPMHLPVLDGANKAMKNHSYTYKTKFADKTVDAATMFDINTAIMRCLVKNIAMFGLALYIYAGEDLPDTQVAISTPIVPPAKLTIPQIPKPATPIEKVASTPLQPSKEFNTLTDTKADMKDVASTKLDAADVATTIKAFGKFDTAIVLSYLLKDMKLRYSSTEDFIRGEDTAVIKKVYNHLNAKK